MIRFLQRLRLNGIHSPEWLKGWFQLRPLHKDETVWHASYENVFGLWSITIHAGLIGLWIIGPFSLRQRKP